MPDVCCSISASAVNRTRKRCHQSQRHAVGFRGGKFTHVLRRSTRLSDIERVYRIGEHCYLVSSRFQGSCGLVRELGVVVDEDDLSGDCSLRYLRIRDYPGK